MIFEKIKECLFCKSKSFQKSKSNNTLTNFYLEAVSSDFKLKKKDLKLIKSFQCNNCSLIFNSPWFKEETARKIYSNVYGQHHNSWQNLIDFVKRKTLPKHGELFNILSSCIEIKKYAEYNSPFMGLFLNFFYSVKVGKNSYKSFHKNIIKYLTSRQLAGSQKNQKIKSIKKSSYYLNKLNIFKSKYSKINRLSEKILFFDQSPISWGLNDNYKSVNSKAYAQEIFDLKLLDINNFKNTIKFDLFGIFHSFDHTNEPKKILDTALRISDYVIIYCHDAEKKLNNQHLFGFNKDFFRKLSKRKIYTLNLSNKININANDQLYFLCSKNKAKIEKFKQKINKMI